MRFSVLIFLLIPFFTKAQSDTAIIYSSVVTVEKVNKDVLFSRAREWFNQTFKDYKSVISIEDKENGELSGKAVMHFDVIWQYMGKTALPVDIEFRVSLKTKDGRYKYEFSDFRVIYFWTQKRNFSPLTSSIEPTEDWKSTTASKKYRKSYYDQTKEGVDKNIQILVQLLKKQMAQSNDW
jgi:hypothetical protein